MSNKIIILCAFLIVIISCIYYHNWSTDQLQSLIKKEEAKRIEYNSKRSWINLFQKELLQKSEQSSLEEKQSFSEEIAFGENNDEYANDSRSRDDILPFH